MLLLPGWGGYRAAAKRNAGVGRKEKMKLRFVKFLTSRENEIEKKEGGGGRSTALACSVTHSQAAAIAPLPLPFPPPTSFHSSSLHPAPPARSSTTPVSPPPRIGRAMPSSYPSPAVPLLPSFFIKLLKRQSVEGRTGAEHLPCRPSCPTQR